MAPNATKDASVSALTTIGPGLLKVSSAAPPSVTEAATRPAPKTRDEVHSRSGRACRDSCRKPAMKTIKAAAYSVSTSLVVTPITLFLVT